MSPWRRPAQTEMEEGAHHCGEVRPGPFDVKDRHGSRPLQGLRERSRSPLNAAADSHHAEGRLDWTQGHTASLRCGAHKPSGSFQDICHHHMCLRKRFEELKQRYEQEKLLWVTEKEVLLREVAEMHAVENRRLLLELRQQLEELRLELRDAEQRRGELSGRYRSDKAAWDVERAELRGRLSQLEAQTDQFPYTDRACASRDRDCPEREGQRCPLADTHGASLDLRRLLQGSEQRWEQQRCGLVERLERERRDWQLQLRRMQRRVEQLQRDIRLRDSGFSDSFSLSRPELPGKCQLEDVPETEVGEDSSSSRPRGRGDTAAPEMPAAKDGAAEAMLDALVSDVLRELEMTGPASGDTGPDDGERTRSSCLNEALSEITRVSQELCSYEDEVRRKARPPRPKSASATERPSVCGGSPSSPRSPTRAHSVTSLLTEPPRFPSPSASSKRRPSETNKRRNWCNSLNLDSIAETPPTPGAGGARPLQAGVPPVPPRTTSWPLSPSQNSPSFSSGELTTMSGGAPARDLSGKRGPCRAATPTNSQNSATATANKLDGLCSRWSCDLTKNQQTRLETNLGTEARAPPSQPPTVAVNKEGQRATSEMSAADRWGPTAVATQAPRGTACAVELGSDAAFRRMVMEHKSAISNARRAAAAPRCNAFASEASPKESHAAAGPAVSERDHSTAAAAWTLTAPPAAKDSGSQNTYVKILDLSKFYRGGGDDGKKSSGVTTSLKGDRGQSFPELFGASCKQRLLNLQQRSKAKSETSVDQHTPPRAGLRHVAADTALFQRRIPASLPGQQEGGVRLAGCVVQPGNGARGGRAAASRSNFGVIQRMLVRTPDDAARPLGADGQQGDEWTASTVVGPQADPGIRAPIPDSHREWQHWRKQQPAAAASARQQLTTSVPVTHPAPSLESHFPRPARPCHRRPPSRWAPRPASAPPSLDPVPLCDPRAPAPAHRLDDPLLVLEILLEDSSQVWRSHH